MTTEDVLMEYRKRLSIRETARELDISEGAVRKCLITHGEIETAMTRRIGALLQEGRSQKEICGMLGISSSCINANSPYERGIQIEPSQTVFQSMHPVPSLWRSTTPYFNPRTPHGVRRASCAAFFMGAKFQSTHPSRGATLWLSIHQNLWSDFNPRTPHGVRQDSRRSRKRNGKFQSTHPSRGATGI